METGLVYYEPMVNHRCLWDDNYEERPERFTEIHKRFKELNLIERCFLLTPRKAKKEEILYLHTIEHYDNVKQTRDINDQQILEEISSKYDAVYFHPSTYELALYSVGSTIDLIESVVNGKIKNGFALIRPPGHHAMVSEPCGYCFFNNVAIGAMHAKNLGLNRILIVDWDVHHGQGTQYPFYDDPNVLYFSVHRYENGAFWPELIESNYNFIGGENAKGFNINVPLNEIGMQNADYLAIWHNILLPIAYEFNPQLVIISAGYDCAIGCPEGEMMLTPAIFSHLCHLLMPISNGKLCVILEGGYCLKSLAESAALTLTTLLGDPCPYIEQLTPLNESLINSVLDVISVLRPYWKCLQLQGTCDRHNDDPEQEDLCRKKHLPFLEYKGSVALTEKPEKYKTRDCYPVQEESTKIQLSLEIDRLIAITDLSKNYIHRTCFVYDDALLLHKSNTIHPERPSRVKSIYENLKENGLLSRCFEVTSRYATETELELVHTKQYIKEIKATQTLSSSDLYEMSLLYNSIYLTNDTYKTATLAAGCLLEIVDSVLTNKCLNGFACIRPPGHHSDQTCASGFCFFNNVAIAAKYAIEKYKKQKILIVDWDIHHGDGTQHIFENDDKIVYISLHRYDYGQFFPSTIKANYNIGKNIINIPWNNGPMADWEYLTAFFNVILPISYSFNPDLVIISAGFDSAIDDPLGEYNLSPKLYGHLTHLLMSLANGKVIIALEGGYNLNSTSLASSECVSALLGNPPKMLDLTDINENAFEVIKNVIDYQSSNWENLKFNYDLPNSLL